MSRDQTGEESSRDGGAWWAGDDGEAKWADKSRDDWAEELEKRITLMVDWISLDIIAGAENEIEEDDEVTWLNNDCRRPRDSYDNW